MARTTSFTKRALITKANSNMVLATTIAAFVLVFGLVAGKSLLGQMAYQNRVISAKKAALAQLTTDLSARDQLQQSYKGFVAQDPNVIGGSAGGTSGQDGDNATLVLDSLPSAYDFPALTTSLEKIVGGQNLKILSITGTDQEATQGGNSTSPTPSAVPMPFQVEVNGAYSSVQALTNVFQNSIRPFQIQTLELSGDEGSMSATIAAQTYYQPGKTLNIKNEVVK
ncbi:MAG TPA: hypothetical protein VLF71_05615 [Candidatus Saccharimonadales bacterium]|nr:hypothetical protein [Candidatus Saccharimonadales bacterium]